MAKEKTSTTAKAFQIKITLKCIKPPIWRRVIVNSNCKLSDLNKIIQTAMGWTNTHLHHFLINDTVYSEPDEESLIEYIDYSNVRLHQVVSKENQVIIYEYDFGDGWEHKIQLEKISNEDSKILPYCIAGRRCCPPEDCGGPYGYMHMLTVISDPKDKEYEEMIEWIGDDFDPEYIDLDEINDMLKQKDFGCITLS